MSTPIQFSIHLSIHSFIHSPIHQSYTPIYRLSGHIHSYIPSCIDEYINLLIHPHYYYSIWSIHTLIHPHVHHIIHTYIHPSIHTSTVSLHCFIDLSILDWLIKIHTCNVSTYIQSLIQLSILLSMQITILYSPLPIPVELIVMNILTQRVCLLQT